MGSSTDDIEFRAALPEHEPAIQALSDATHTAHRNRLPHAFSPENDYQQKLLVAAFDPAIRAKLKYNLDLVVACRGDDMLGYVLVIWHRPDAGHEQINAMIADIATFEHARGQGIGAALLGHLRGRMQTEGWDSLTADVWHGNTASHALFTKSDFTPEQTKYRFGQPPARSTPASAPRTPTRLPWLIPLLILGAAALIASVP